MKPSRLLLPFTHGVHTTALDYAVMLAKSRNAILVPLSIMAVAHEKGAKGVRLERIQQSKDFLAAVQHKANREDVAVECVEVFVSDIVDGINSCVEHLHCQDVLLFVQNSDAVLLQTHEAKQVIKQVACKHHVIRLPAKKQALSKPMLLKRFFQFLQGQVSTDIDIHIVPFHRGNSDRVKIESSGRATIV